MAVIYMSFQSQFEHTHTFGRFLFSYPGYVWYSRKNILELLRWVFTQTRCASNGVIAQMSPVVE